MWSCMTSAASSLLMRYDHSVLHCFMTSETPCGLIMDNLLQGTCNPSQNAHSIARSLAHSLTDANSHWKGILCSSSCMTTCLLHLPPPPLPPPPPTDTVVAEKVTPYGTYSWDTVQAVFWREFHESRGDMQIRLSSWSRHTALGHVRELSFVSPIKVWPTIKNPFFALVAVVEPAGHHHG